MPTSNQKIGGQGSGTASAGNPLLAGLEQQYGENTGEGNAATQANMDNVGGAGVPGLKKLIPGYGGIYDFNTDLGAPVNIPGFTYTGAQHEFGGNPAIGAAAAAAGLSPADVARWTAQGARAAAIKDLQSQGYTGTPQQMLQQSATKNSWASPTGDAMMQAAKNLGIPYDPVHGQYGTPAQRQQIQAAAQQLVTSGAPITPQTYTMPGPGSFSFNGGGTAPAGTPTTGGADPAGPAATTWATTPGQQVGAVPNPTAANTTPATPNPFDSTPNFTTGTAGGNMATQLTTPATRAGSATSPASTAMPGGNMTPTTTPATRPATTAAPPAAPAPSATPGQPTATVSPATQSPSLTPAAVTPKPLNAADILKPGGQASAQSPFNVAPTNAAPNPFGTTTPTFMGGPTTGVKQPLGQAKPNATTGSL
jgi:hypothetical protein